jgi:hypothetical protein
LIVYILVRFLIRRHEASTAAIGVDTTVDTATVVAAARPGLECDKVEGVLIKPRRGRGLERLAATDDGKRGEEACHVGEG